MFLEELLQIILMFWRKHELLIFIRWKNIIFCLNDLSFLKFLLILILAIVHSFLFIIERLAYYSV